MSQRNKSSPLVIDTWRKLIILLNETKEWPIANITIQIQDFDWHNWLIYKIRIDKEYGFAHITLIKEPYQEFLVLTKDSFKSNDKPRNITKKRRLRNARSIPQRT